MTGMDRLRANREARLRATLIKASLTYSGTQNPRRLDHMLGHTKLESTVRYLDILVHDALRMAQQAEV